MRSQRVAPLPGDAEDAKHDVGGLETAVLPYNQSISNEGQQFRFIAPLLKTDAKIISSVFSRASLAERPDSRHENTHIGKLYTS